MINVGVDVWNFRPVTYEEINSRLAKWKRANATKKIENEDKCEGTSPEV